MEPRAIAPQDIRVGDEVVARRVDCRVEGVVTQVGDMYIYIGWAQPIGARTSEWTFTIIDRPEPPRQAGSRWRDPIDGGLYVRTDGTLSEYVRYNIGLIGSCLTTGDPVIARLVPLDGE